MNLVILVINPQWKTKRFVNTLPFSMNGIHQITIRRDEEYNLVAVAEGDYVETEECQLEEGTLIKESVLKGIWNHYYNASLINCFAMNCFFNSLELSMGSAKCRQSESETCMPMEVQTRISPSRQ